MVSLRDCEWAIRNLADSLFKTLTMTQYIYLSPHFDDASLSCGGTIHQQTQSGQAVLAITICAASPTDPFSPYTQMMHQRWGNPLDVVATRQAEDIAAMKILGASYLHLDVPDCIYRGYPDWYYTSDEAIFGEIHHAESSVAAKFLACEPIKSQPQSTICAPLGVGHHVDHQRTHLAAWELHRQGYQVCFYEDYPYADPNYPFTQNFFRHSSEAYRLEPRLRQVEAERSLTLKPHLHYFSAEDLQAKIESMCAYASQIFMLFGDKAEVTRRMQDYNLSVGEGKLAERVWVGKK